ncbi:Gaa1-like protein [Pseudomassariella vexata]|uniref:Gaa1-like protein n=1 Tax=Pseudomassariella vexata TaxID=1141098 RepID=A0A1Y2DNH0_9PEZI|nr:Gaa1-like protein [Pseudomassariella vexata]ORY60719.1 Gaa1-like protein [Pseudomassariella vexata]
MMPNVHSFSALRARSYVFRLPLFTRAIVVVITLLWLASIQSVWDVRQWGALIPDQVSLFSAYRMNTFPLIHINFIHALMNVLALTPLMERFESEYGTLTSLAMFIGPLSTIPALLYIFVERAVLRGNTAVMGASMWVFLLLGMEAIRTYKSNPHLVIGTHHVPTWTTPLVLTLVVAALVPSTSFLGHLCGVAVGYIFGLGYLKFLSPPEKALRWVEAKLNLLGRLPHYVSVDQKTYGRFGVLPTSSASASLPGLVGTSVLFARRDARLLKLPPYISLLCILIGLGWLLMLPADGYSRRTYISENALLPGQVHTYFGGSDQNVFRAYRHEVTALANRSNTEINDKLEDMFGGMGLKVGRQNYTYHSSGNTLSGENIYAILQAPRGDATEAIVLVAAWKNVKGEFNRSALALALALTRYFKRWSLWSKDIILVVPPDSRAGTQAWVDAYHDAHDAATVSSLPLKSGALQGAVAIDYPFEGRFGDVHIVYDGVNGQLPNLDLINSVVNIASGQMGMGATIQEMWRHSDKYNDRLKTMLRGMMNQGLGHAAGPHSSFIPYHVDAITIQPIGQGWHDEMGLGRLIEGTFRSLNNLLEHLHQSFFFYLLMHKERFVSIGTYLPSAMLIAANFTIMAISLWVKSGYATETEPKTEPKTENSPTEKDAEGKEHPDPAVSTVERDLFLPLGLVTACQFLGFLPLFVFNYAPSGLLTPLFSLFAALTLLLPHGLASFLSSLSSPPTPQHYQLFSSFSLLLLGMFLSSLATLNFSLALLVGLLASPLTFVRPLRHPILKYGCAALLSLFSPPIVVVAGAVAGEVGLRAVLEEAAFGWGVWGMYTPLVVWCVWWPAWVVGMVVLLGRTGVSGKAKSA